jgi:hypothetical protein
MEGSALTSLIDNIRNGKYDKHLDTIIRVINERKAERTWDLQPGAKVRLSKLIRPLYLRGATGTIREFSRTRIIVDLDLSRGRFYRGIRVTAPMIEPIEELPNG